MIEAMSEEPINDEITVEPEVMEVDELRGLQRILHERINGITHKVELGIENTGGGPQPNPRLIGKTSV